MLVNQTQDLVETFLGILQVTWAQVPEASWPPTAKLTIPPSSKEQVSAATDGDSSFPRKRSVAGSVTVLYNYDEEKERIIHLLLHIRFIFDLINIYMDNIIYFYVIAALMSINAFLLINCVGFLYSSLLGLIMVLLTCYMFARVNVFSVCNKVDFQHAVNVPPVWSLRGSLPKSGPLDFATKYTFPSFFDGEETLVGMF